VTLNPPQAVIFRENKEEGKAVSSIDIINKSSEAYILFKVKTTEPNNYIVRPNQGVIKPESSINVKIICQVNLSQVYFASLRLIECQLDLERQIPGATHKDHPTKRRPRSKIFCPEQSFRLTELRSFGKA
jgi:hypothetical protein